MNKHNTPQQNNEDKKIDQVLHELSCEPQTNDVQKSFRATMDTVTKLPVHRIPERTHTEFTFINSYIMHNIKKLVGLSAAAFALVLMVGYFTFFNGSDSEYEDIFAAALDDEESYVMAMADEDDFSDLIEEDLDIDIQINDVVTSDPITPTTPQNENSVPVPPVVTAPDVETTLAALDALFANDDIDDSELEEWFADTSAGDTLTQTYDI